MTYTCPMHPKVRKEHAGLCPECGMNLIEAKIKESSQDEKGSCCSEKSSHEKHGEDKHQGHKTNIFKLKFWVSFALSIPVVLYSDIVTTLFGWQTPAFPGSAYIPFVLGSVIFFYGGWIFLVSSYRELRARLPGMMTLISFAIITAYTYSVYVVFSGGERALFWELATLITIMLLGHWMEMRAVTGAQGALKELSKLLPDTAEVVRGNTTEIIPLAEVRVDDEVLVKPGSKIPVDGVVVSGNSEVDESVATGESKSVSKKETDEVIAGTSNGDGSLTLRVTKIGAHTFLAGVMRLVEEAQASKSRLQLLSDKAAFYLTIIAVATGFGTFMVWSIVADSAFAIERMVAVLVIACPHALGLAIPLVASISTTKAAENGFLVKQRIALEAARTIDVVLFDKTGTLTTGMFDVYKVLPAENYKEEDVLKVAAAVNRHSEHSIATAIVSKARKKNIEIAEAYNFERIAGKGSQAEVNGKVIYIGSNRLFEERHSTIADGLKKEVAMLSQEGKTIIYVMDEKTLMGVIVLGDVIREESREAIIALKEAGIQTAMITGDSDDVARWVAGELGITRYFARVLPHEKSEKVKLLQAQGKKVAMVGDGINDAPALTQADLGIAIGAGTNIAIESAGIILVRNDPRDIARIVLLSKFTFSKMIQNLFWATGYNVIAIPLAAGVLVSYGIVLQPALAALFMSLSTIIVAVNALLLKRRELV